MLAQRGVAGRGPLDSRLILARPGSLAAHDATDTSKSLAAALPSPPYREARRVAGVGRASRSGLDPSH
jgi:hypothetical protein